jgi:hypothetical protein
MAAREQAEQEARQARVAQLTSEQRDQLLKCTSSAQGRMAALRNAGQASLRYISGSDDLTDYCLANPYYYETIPAPAVVMQND